MDDLVLDNDFNFQQPGHDNMGYDDSETQDIGGMFADNVQVIHHDVAGEDNSNTQKNIGKRGENIVRWFADGVRERVKWAKNGCPLWPRTKCAEFSRFIGRLASDGGLYPISIKDWRYFKPDVNHRLAWERVKVTIDWDYEDATAKKGAIKSHVLARLNERWRMHKKYLKHTFWAPNQESHKRFQCSDKSVDKTQWLEFVKYLDAEDTKTKAAINSSNRNQRTTHHSTGTRTFQAVINDWKLDTGVDEEPDRVEIFKLTHCKKGSKHQYVDAASAKTVLAFDKAEEERRNANVAITPEVREEIYAEVLGVEKRHRVRGLGSGFKWIDVPYVHTEKRVSRNIADLVAQLAEQRLQAEKEKLEAAEREKKYVSDMEKFMAEHKRDMEDQKRMLEENSRKVQQAAVAQLSQWMREAENVYPTLGSPLSQAFSQAFMTQQPSMHCLPNPNLGDYRPAMPTDSAT